MSLYNENASHSSMVEATVRTVLRRAFDKEHAIAGVVEQDGRIAGCLFLHVDRQWYSDQPYLLEIFNYVYPGHRKSTCAKSLIAWAKSTSDRLALPLMVGIISNTRTEAKVRLYERQLRKVGAYFLYNAHHAPAGEASIVVS